MMRLAAGFGLVLTVAAASVALANSTSAAAPVSPASVAPSAMLPAKPILLAQAEATPPVAPAAPVAPAGPVAPAADAAAPAAPAAAAPAAANGLTGEMDMAGLPLGTGHDLTVAKCSGCHDVSEFSNQRHTSDEWGDIIGSMIGRGADINEADFVAIQTYLTAALPRPVQ